MKSHSINSDTNKRIMLKNNVSQSYAGPSTVGCCYEQVATIKGVSYINVSKATGEDSALSPDLIKRNIIWILEGADADIDIALSGLVKERVTAVIALGSNIEKISEAFHDKTSFLIVDAISVVEAVQLAAIIAKEGDAVLFSSTCPNDKTDDEESQFVNAVNLLK